MSDFSKKERDYLNFLVEEPINSNRLLEFMSFFDDAATFVELSMFVEKMRILEGNNNQQWYKVFNFDRTPLNIKTATNSQTQLLEILQIHSNLIEQGIGLCCLEKCRFPIKVDDDAESNKGLNTFKYAIKISYVRLCIKALFQNDTMHVPLLGAFSTSNFYPMQVRKTFRAFIERFLASLSYFSCILLIRKIDAAWKKTLHQFSRKQWI